MSLLARAAAVATCLGCALLGPYAPGLAMGPPALVAQARVTTPPAPVVITVSGGKSLGSYQAGLNWGLIQAMKYSHRPEARARLARPYALAATTGASAGNINALISAAEWCDDGPLRPPESSLFYKVWVRTGWEQLLAPVPYAEVGSEHQAILHREFFERHFAELDQALEQATPRDCDVPIGITLTKLVRGSIELGQLDIPTQRFVSVVRLTTVLEDGVPRLRFALPESALRNDATLGKRVFLAVDGDSLELNGGTYVVPSRRVYQLSEASSAFPVAFEPESLAVIDPESIDDCEGETLPAGAGCRSQASYLDGGLFDNSPVDLGLRLLEHRRNRYRSAPAADTRLVYVEAGQYRQPLDSVRVRRATDERMGLGGAFQMVSEAIPAARKYELHALARNLRAESDTLRAGWIRVTSRAYPIVGEHLAGFAAFLGRPFREFDFYVGVYDALHFIATELCPEEASRDFRKSAALATCKPDAMRTLIEDETFALGDHATFMLARIFRAEFGEVVRGPRAPELTDDRAILLGVLARAQQDLLQPRAAGPDPCRELGSIEAAVCSNGFDRILAALRADTAAMRVIDTWADTPECYRDRWESAQSDDCLADYTLRELVRNPPLFMSRTAEQVLRQLWRVEAGLEAQGARNQKDLIQFAELWFRSAWGKYQDRWDTDPSSIPDGESFGNWLFHLAPNQINVAAGTKGGDVWGYRPTYHLGPGWALVAPVSLTYVRPVINTDERWRVHAGFGVLQKSGGVMYSGAQITADVLHAPQWSDPAAQGRSLWGATGTVYAVGGKFTLSLRWIPGNETELYAGDDVAVILGLADFNGLLYWVRRGLFG